MSKRKKVDYLYGFTGTPCIPHPASRIPHPRVCGAGTGAGWTSRTHPVPVCHPILSITLRSQRYITVSALYYGHYNNCN